MFAERNWHGETCFESQIYGRCSKISRNFKLGPKDWKINFERQSWKKTNLHSTQNEQKKRPGLKISIENDMSNQKSTFQARIVCLWKGSFSNVQARFFSISGPTGSGKTNKNFIPELTFRTIFGSNPARKIQTLEIKSLPGVWELPIKSVCSGLREIRAAFRPANIANT